MITTKEINYSIYGKCLAVESGKLTMYITLDVGPRVIYASLDGSENLFHNDVKTASYKSDEELSFYYGENKGGWHIYGGHRLWCAPESLPETYYPDNEKLDYEVNGNTVTLICPERSVSKLAPKFEFTFDGEKVTVKHMMKNNSEKTQRFALWALSVMAPGGIAEVVNPPLGEGLLPTRSAAFWPYASPSDSRFSLDEDAFRVYFSGAKLPPFKFGILNTSGVCRFVSREGVIFEKTVTTYTDREYPDFGCSCEVYTCDKFTELETIAPLEDVLPGGVAQHVENWEFKR